MTHSLITKKLLSKFSLEYESLKTLDKSYSVY